MQQKKMFKVLSAIDKRDGGTFWMRVGSGFTNRDNSVNIYLDVFPKSFQLQLRELDEEDLRRRESSRAASGGGGGGGGGGDGSSGGGSSSSGGSAAGSSPDLGLPF